MPRPARFLILLAALAAPAAASAQLGVLELTPTAGFRRSGNIIIQERAFQNRDFEVGVNASGSFGLILDVMVAKSLGIELLFSLQDGAFEDEQSLFGETPGGFTTPGDTELLDMSVLHYHAGLIWDMGSGWTRPFVTGGVGVTKLDPKNLPLPSDTKVSFSIGGGLKMDLNETFGLRFDGRVFFAGTDDAIVVTEQFEHQDCTDPCTYTYSYDSKFVQGEILLGLTFRP